MLFCPLRTGGFIILQKEMRAGYTTGSCAAAGALAALRLLLCGESMVQALVMGPRGDEISVPIKEVLLTGTGARAIVIKDAGDDPDITHGVEVVADVRLTDGADIVLAAGEGVGTVTKPGLAVSPGQPAINPGPRRMIEDAARAVLGETGGCEVTVSIPGGEALAKRTLNPMLGIVGGLSVIGTSGVVRPMSEEAFKDSLVPQISVARAAGCEAIVFVPGKIGENAARNAFGLPQAALVQTSNFIGFMLEAAARQGVKQVLLFGHLGKLAKVAAGVFHTHNRVGDGRMEAIAAHLAALGADAPLVRAVLDCTTTEAALPLIEAQGLEAVYESLARRASERAMRYVFGDLTVGTVLVTLKGALLGMDENAKRIGGELGWNIKS